MFRVIAELLLPETPGQVHGSENHAERADIRDRRPETLCRYRQGPLLAQEKDGEELSQRIVGDTGEGVRAVCAWTASGEILSSRPEELYLEDFATITNVGMGYQHDHAGSPDHSVTDD